MAMFITVDAVQYIEIPAASRWTTYWCCPKQQPIPYTVHYFWPGPAKGHSVNKKTDVLTPALLLFKMMRGHILQTSLTTWAKPNPLRSGWRGPDRQWWLWIGQLVSDGSGLLQHRDREFIIIVLFTNVFLVSVPPLLCPGRKSIRDTLCVFVC